MINVDQYDHFSCQANTLLHFFNLFNLYQHNRVINANHNTLDLVFSTLLNISILLAAELLCLCDSYHPVIVLSLMTLIKFFSTPTYETKWNFKHADFMAINEYLGSISWDEELSYLDTNKAVNLLHSHLNYVIIAFVSQYSIRKSTFPIWFSADLIYLIRAKKEAHYKFKKTVLQIIWRFLSWEHNVRHPQDV